MMLVYEWEDEYANNEEVGQPKIESSRNHRTSWCKRSHGLNLCLAKSSKIFSSKLDSKANGGLHEVRLRRGILHHYPKQWDWNVWDYPAKVMKRDITVLWRVWRSWSLWKVRLVGIYPDKTRLKIWRYFFLRRLLFFLKTGGWSRQLWGHYKGHQSPVYLLF